MPTSLACQLKQELGHLATEVFCEFQGVSTRTYQILLEVNDRNLAFVSCWLLQTSLQ